MKKKQLDLFGNSVSSDKVTQVIEGIKRKAESLIYKSDLEPILKIISQERDISKWPVKRLLSKIIAFFEGKGDAIKPEIVESVLESLNKLQKIQKDEISIRTFFKIYRGRKDLFEFFLHDSSNLLTQFYRIFSFIHFVFILMEKIDADREKAMEKVEYVDPKDGEEWYRVYEKEENRIILGVCVGIVDGQFHEISRYSGIGTKIPLKLDENLPDSLKKKYVLSLD